ncbi:MAG: four-carbon acid sugar kinase family protein [Rhizobacter sp.]|nr:four-carbon acid sugar kinase family protein [Rhizobacter sp.]
MTIKLGCIADDFTGATDLANNLVRAGMRAVQTIGVPDVPLGSAADAVVVALKSRTIGAAEAVEQSLAALRWLQAQGAEQFYFKVCSTFDSTAQGNIGPVTEALMDALGSTLTLVTPAFPDNQRTVFKGHLFVGDVLLSDSGMRHHPLTPMNDSSLVRVLQAQSARKVGLVERQVVARGADAIRERCAQLQRDGVAMAIVDAIENDDLVRLGLALKGALLVTAGSGVAIGLPQNWGLRPSVEAVTLPRAGGARAIISGSCSVATNAQVADALGKGVPGFMVDPLAVAAGLDVVSQALAWAREQPRERALLINATAAPDRLQSVQARLGAAQAGALVERTLSAIALGLVEAGVRQLVVAGGETSGAVVQALGVRQLQIGPQIDPGVPWCAAASPAAGGELLHLALKSGNFGSSDFFTKAFTLLQ